METTVEPTAPKGARNSAFNRRALNFLKDIECRPLVTQDDLEALYRFRYDRYRAVDQIPANTSGQFRDSMDDAPNVMPFALYRDGRLVSSIRFHHLTRDARQGPSMVSHGDVVGPMLDMGFTMIDPSRLTIDAQDNEERMFLPYVTVRMAGMASLHFDVDYSLSLIRTPHAAFYKKIFGSRPVGEARTYPGVNFEVCLLMAEIRAAHHDVLRRYPFFDSLPREREALFGPAPMPKQHYDRTRIDTMRRPLTVRPSAMLALAA